MTRWPLVRDGCTPRPGGQLLPVASREAGLPCSPPLCWQEPQPQDPGEESPSSWQSSLGFGPPDSWPPTQSSSRGNKMSTQLKPLLSLGRAFGLTGHFGGLERLEHQVCQTGPVGGRRGQGASDHPQQQDGDLSHLWNGDGQHLAGTPTPWPPHRAPALPACLCRTPGGPYPAQVCASRTAAPPGPARPRTTLRQHAGLLLPTEGAQEPSAQSNLLPGELWQNPTGPLPCRESVTDCVEQGVLCLEGDPASRTL